MATKTFAGITVEVNEEGYFIDSSQWSREIAADMAKENDLELTEKHYQVLEYIRDRVAKGDGLTIRAIGKSGITDIKAFYQLFPGAPLKLSTKLAGVAKPSSCI